MWCAAVYYTYFRSRQILITAAQLNDDLNVHHARTFQPCPSPWLQLPQVRQICRVPGGDLTSNEGTHVGTERVGVNALDQPMESRFIISANHQQSISE